MKNIAESLDSLRSRIRRAEQKFGRSPGSVRLIAVSKTRPTADILEAMKNGQLEFGENYVQEAVEKVQTIGNPDITWHFIGPVQSNKTGLIARNFHWVHSIDRIKIARRLSDARPAQLPALNICLQINIDDEAGKSGITPAEIPELLSACRELPGLRVRGLMALPAPCNTFAEQRHSFHRVKTLVMQLRDKGEKLDILSMGTTNDYEAAIAEGANIIRVGTAIFGSRS